MSSGERGERRLGVAAALVDGAVLPGDVTVADGRVARVGVHPAGRAGLAAPGLVDLQVNGFGGVDLLAADVAGYAEAGAALLAHGVTAYQPTLISSPLAAYERALGVAGRARRALHAPRILGVHLEGPFLSPRFPGAHDRANLRDADPALAERLLGLGPVTYVTLAPELPGGLELVARLAARGVVVAVGHSDADATVALAAFERGASALTHLGNAQRRPLPRDPAAATVALLRDGVSVQAIVDGVHLAHETVEAAWRVAGSRLTLVSDAMLAAGCGDGEHRFAGLEVRVRDGRATLADGTLAGSVVTLDAAVRNLHALGIPLPAALRAAARAPALAARRPELGLLVPGAPADVVVLDDALTVRATLVHGREAYAC